jgi:hypothetical protein
MSMLNFRVVYRRFNVLRTVESQGFDIETSAGWRSFNRHIMYNMTLAIT